MAFEKYAAVYDLLYRDKNYGREADYLIKVASLESACRVLELGCGTGGHALEFARRGMTVHGVDLSDEMLTLAHRKVEQSGLSRQVTFSTGDVASLSLGQSFSRVLSLFHVVCYQIAPDGLKAFLNSAWRHLEPNGFLVFDYWNAASFRRTTHSTRVKRAEDGHYRIVRISETRPSQHSDEYEVHFECFLEHKAEKRIESFAEVHRMRALSPDEIDRTAKEVGFQSPVHVGWLTERPLEDEDLYGLAVMQR